MPICINSLFVNPVQQNELLIDKKNGSGIAMVIYDPSGSHGAYNFLALLQSMPSPGALEIDELLSWISQLIDSSAGQFELMDIRAHARWAFFVSQFEDELRAHS